MGSVTRTIEQEPALSIEHLSVVFGTERRVVDDLTLSVPTGALYGIVGPNGAGKTTTLLAALGLVDRSEGLTTVFGVDTLRDADRVKPLVGIQADALPPLPQLTGRQWLIYLSQLWGIDRPEERADSLLEQLTLDKADSTLIANYSAGMAKKIAIASALVHRPRLLVLDEPFESLDPLAVRRVRTLLQSHTEDGGTIVVSSHSMALVEQIATHVAVLADGHLQACGEVAVVRGQHGNLEDAFVAIVGATTAHRTSVQRSASREDR